MIEKLKICWETYHPRSFTVSLRKNNKELYDWVIEQPNIIPTSTFADKVFTLLNPIIPHCKNCNNPVTSVGRNGWAEYCSTKCKGQHNSLKSRDKAKQTSLLNWGVENPTQSPIIRKKMMSTMIDRYGVDFIKKSPLYREKTKQTMIDRYGVEYAIQYDDFKKKIKETCIERYGVENPSQRNIPKDVFEKLEDKNWLDEQNKIFSISEIAEILNVSYPTIGKYFRKHNIVPAAHNQSKKEREIIEFIKNNALPGTLIKEGNKTIIYPYELDIFIESLNVAFEFNGSWYHSELNGKDRYYHLRKTELCSKKGIQLIHIWEHDYENKKDIILSKINHILGKSKTIYARKCTIAEVNKEDSADFLNKTHIQGSCIDKIRLGLYFSDMLVGVMTFGKTRFNKKYQYELLRYSTKLNHHVVGGFSKLFKHFTKHYLPDSIITYSDKEWSKGDVYIKNGFIHNGVIPPSYFYTNDYINFKNRINFQKKKLPSLIENFNITLTEWENMKNNGYDRIWNCGNDSWVWINK